MERDEYVELAQVTETQDYSPCIGRVDTRMIRLLHAALGLSSELAEIREALNKAKAEASIDYVNLAEEAGDLCWYTAIAIAALGLDPKDFWDNSVPNTLCAPIESISITTDALVISVGEFHNRIKRALFYGKHLDIVGAGFLLQDISQCISNMTYQVGSNPSAVRERNIAKLKARYGDKFTEHAALNRNLEKERDVLEGK